MNRSMLMAAAALLCAAILTGCSTSTGQYAYGSQESDVVGAWTTLNGPEIELVLNPDGTLEAQQWPAPLTCRNVDVPEVDDFAAEPTATVTGEWSVFAGEQPGGLPTVSLSITDTSCPDSHVVAYLWRDEEGHLSACLPLESVLHPDNFSPNRLWMFTPRNEDAASEAPCFG
ncbi:hypothetical protein E4V99_06985 [Microbacterium sp. dk485]|uniref:hypothetical protein n=1 Tax=Microbacterium sp. dk485 TaxID=2560021 RepID=UPI00107373FE|nr:hypothetical protein [Microbacterium sp. dk485]TFV84782.1 hypothetical protein E4V99_06985 [Microbacterium sp. dk485]